MNSERVISYGGYVRRCLTFFLLYEIVLCLPATDFNGKSRGMKQSPLSPLPGAELMKAANLSEVKGNWLF